MNFGYKSTFSSLALECCPASSGKIFRNWVGALGADGDYGHQAAAAVCLFAVAEQAVNITRRAQLGDEHVFFADSRFDELRPICFLQI